MGRRRSYYSSIRCDTRGKDKKTQEVVVERAHPKCQRQVTTLGSGDRVIMEVVVLTSFSEVGKV